MTIGRGERQVIEVTWKSRVTEGGPKLGAPTGPGGPPELPLLAELGGHTDQAWDTRFTPDGLLISSGWDKTIRLWDPVTRKSKGVLLGHTKEVIILALAPDGKTLASAAGHWHERNKPGEVKLWDLPNRKERPGGKMLPGLIHAFSFSHDGKLLAATCDGTVHVWEFDTGKDRGSFPGEFGVFSPTENLLACAGANGTVTFWDVYSKSEIAYFRPHTAHLAGLSFSDDGKMLATGCWDHTAKVSDVKTHAELMNLKGHTAPVGCIAFSPDGRLVASGSGDGDLLGELKLWEVATGKELAMVKGQRAILAGFAFSPDGKLLSSAGTDGSVKLWDVSKWSKPKQLPASEDGKSPPQDLKELRQQAALAAKKLEQARNTAKEGKSPETVPQAEIRVFEAELRLAEAEKKPTDQLTIDLLDAQIRLAQVQKKPIDEMVKQLVSRLTARWQESTKRFQAGEIPEAEVDRAEKKLIEAQLKYRSDGSVFDTDPVIEETADGRLTQTGLMTVHLSIYRVNYPRPFAFPPELSVMTATGFTIHKVLEGTASGFQLQVTGEGYGPVVRWRATGPALKAKETTTTKNGLVEVDQNRTYEVKYPKPFARPPHLQLRPHTGLQYGPLIYAVEEETAKGFSFTVTGRAQSPTLHWRATGVGADESKPLPPAAGTTRPRFGT